MQLRSMAAILTFPYISNMLGSTVVFLRAYYEAFVVLYRGTPKQQGCSVVVEG